MWPLLINVVLMIIGTTTLKLDGIVNGNICFHLDTFSDRCMTDSILQLDTCLHIDRKKEYISEIVFVEQL